MGKEKTSTVNKSKEIKMTTKGKTKKNQKNEKLDKPKKNIGKSKKNDKQNQASKNLKKEVGKTKKEKKIVQRNQKTTKKEKKKVKVQKEVLTNGQKEELKRLIDLFSLENNNDLKDLLRKNNQKISGSKSELVERCSEGKLLGALPNCPKCFGGKLRFNLKTGEYSCPGYMEDTTMIYCNFKSNDVKRNAWLD